MKRGIRKVKELNYNAYTIFKVQWIGLWDIFDFQKWRIYAQSGTAAEEYVFFFLLQK